jgi:Glycosyl hydrolases family 2, TIM barrel domain/Glycosyl hydrolases family 2/Glycosyl hydrolases family 2, sugar binding domain
MVDRRKFMMTAGATAIAPVVSGVLAKPVAATADPTVNGRSRISLAGEWDRFLAGAFYDRVPVPSSQRPLGFYTLWRTFNLPRLSSHQRAILHFDAVTYYGQVSLNGTVVGTMGPYLPYEFDLTPHAKEGANHVNVAIADLAPGPEGEGKVELGFGVSRGWECYGGIIRDVYAEVRPAVYVDNAKFGYRLNGDYTEAECEVTVYVSGLRGGKGEVEVRLEQGATEVARATKSFEVKAGISEVQLPFRVRGPVLWSPEAPNLYGLKVRLRSGVGEDQWETRTGFRDVAIRGSEFFLNGQPLVLKGVCRHDMWKGEGFTLTRGQMEEDMRMIKELGCNFVRLVHYPHHRRIVELADEVGLLVSEEPGYWGMDFRTMPQAMIELGYRIMEGTIRRDWNSPSVFAWLLGNECRLTVEYLKEGKARCRKLDPLSRPVSFANDMPMEQAKPIFEQAGMDFFDQHIYTFDVERFRKAAEFYGNAKPFTQTEWGAMMFGQSRPVMESTVDLLIELERSKQVAGNSYWEWADMIQFTREGWMMHNGVLIEGVVTESREPREEVYMELARLFGQRMKTEAVSICPTVVPLKLSVASPQGSFSPVDLQSLAEGADGERSWAALKGIMAKYWAGVRMAHDQWDKTGGEFLLWEAPEVKISGIPFRNPVVNGHVRPLVLTPGLPEVTIPLKLEGTRLHILGQVTLPKGYPLAGKQGETVATYRLRYSDGKEQVIPVRNGIETAQANLIDEATRINPVATAAPRALTFVKDIAREHYQALLWPVPLRKGPLQNLHCKLESQQPALAIFAITVEHAS